MATASKVHLSPADSGVFHRGNITPEAAAKASEVLQENHEIHHIFFGQAGFHNHISHHILTLFALGASPDEIQKHYNNNKAYQRPAQPIDNDILQKLHDYKGFHNHLGNERYYHDYLLFFQGEMDKKGHEEVLNEYLFKGDDRADDLLVRIYAGFLHPIIHLGFGVEFKQPAIMAEALAEAAVHDAWIGKFLLGAEEEAEAKGKPTSKSMVALLDEIREDKKLSTAAHWDDGNKIRDGILVRAKDEMLAYASQWNVKPEQLEEKTAEMNNAVVYYTGGAQHPPKQVKFDFYYMHCLNSAIFFSAFLEQPWLSTANKVRLLEWKGRVDLCMYASRRSPKPLLDEIVQYKSSNPIPFGEEGWNEVFTRVKKFEDDGHGSKLVRAIAHAEEICKPYGEREDFRIQNKMWLQLGNMAIDSVTDGGDTWVRSAGFDEAWEKYEDRPKAQL